MIIGKRKYLHISVKAHWPGFSGTHARGSWAVLFTHRIFQILFYYRTSSFSCDCLYLLKNNWLIKNDDDVCFLRIFSDYDSQVRLKSSDQIIKHHVPAKVGQEGWKPPGTQTSLRTQTSPFVEEKEERKREESSSALTPAPPALMTTPAPAPEWRHGFWSL